MVKQAASRTIEVEPIDRLEEKVKLLVGLVTSLREDQARAAAEHTKLTHEIDALRARLGGAEEAGVELSTLRDERDIIRTRVAEMLQQLEAI